MAGATVYVNQAPVPLLYVSATQINFQVPSSLAAGTASMYVTRDGGQSALFHFTVVSNSPGIFQDTSNHAIAQNATDNSTNSSSNPVASGAVLVVYLTGQGAVNNLVADGTATPDLAPRDRHRDGYRHYRRDQRNGAVSGTDARIHRLGAGQYFGAVGLATADYPLVITVGGYVSASAMVSVSGSGTAPPTYLTLVGQLNFANGTASSVAIYGDTTYLCGPNQINIINTSNVSAPTYVGDFGDAQLVGNGGKCAINLNTSEPILVDIVGPGTAPTFAVYSLSDPDSPALLIPAIHQPVHLPHRLSFLGTTGYVSTSWFTTSGTSITAQYGNFVAYDFSTLFPLLLGVLSNWAGIKRSERDAEFAGIVPSTGSYPNTAYVTTTTATGNSTSGVGSAGCGQYQQSAEHGRRGAGGWCLPPPFFLGSATMTICYWLTGNTTSFHNPGVPISTSQAT